MATTTTALSRLEQGPRRSLQWGGGCLAMGLALVGVGAQHEGAVFALFGLLLTVYGIHTFGRLGPDDRDPATEEVRRELRRQADTDRLWQGLLGLTAGLALVLGPFFGGGQVEPGNQLTAFAAIAVGALRAIQGVMALRSPAPAATGKVRSKVAPRRRMDKSPPP